MEGGGGEGSFRRSGPQDDWRWPRYCPGLLACPQARRMDGAPQADSRFCPGGEDGWPPKRLRYRIRRVESHSGSDHALTCMLTGIRQLVSLWDSSGTFSRGPREPRLDGGQSPRAGLRPEVRARAEPERAVGVAQPLREGDDRLTGFEHHRGVRKTWEPCSRLGSQARDCFSPGCRLGSGGMTPASASAGFHALVFQVVRLIAPRQPV